MITARNEFRLKFGMAKEAIALMKGSPAKFWSTGGQKGRVFTDLTGHAYTLVLEFDFKDLAAMQEELQTRFNDPEWESYYAKFKTLVESSSRELYTRVEL